MRKGGLAVAICVSLLSAGGAAWCHQRATAFQNEAEWLKARGDAQAEEYVQKLDGSFADAQLQAFAQRRAVMEKAYAWQRGMMLGVMGAALALVAAYALFLLKRLDDQLADAMPDLRSEPASPEPAPALATHASIQR